MLLQLHRPLLLLLLFLLSCCLLDALLLKLLFLSAPLNREVSLFSTLDRLYVMRSILDRQSMGRLLRYSWAGLQQPSTRHAGKRG
jgi:hypothetical protein